MRGSLSCVTARRPLRNALRAYCGTIRRPASCATQTLAMRTQSSAPGRTSSISRAYWPLVRLERRSCAKEGAAPGRAIREHFLVLLVEQVLHATVQLHVARDPIVCAQVHERVR